MQKDITVYRCKKCGRETDDDLECVVPAASKGTDFRPYQKETPQAELPPWGNSAPGSNEHHRLLTDWIVFQQNKKGWDRIKVYVEAQRAGWHLEAYPEIDEDIKQALVDLDLLKGNKEQEEPMREESVKQVAPEKPPTPTVGSPIPLEEIIKQMQENSK